MRRVDGLVLEVADCERLAPVLADAARISRSTEIARLAIAVAAVAADRDRSWPEACGDRADVVTLAAWAHSNEMPLRTARRWAQDGRIDGASKQAGRWVVRSTSTS